MLKGSALKLSCLWQVLEGISGQLGEFYYRLYSLVIKCYDDWLNMFNCSEV